MKSRSLLLTFLLLFVGSFASLGRTAPTSSSNTAFDPALFVVEIRGLEKSLKEKKTPSEIASFRDALPASWTVAAPDRTYTISSQPFREQLTPESQEKALAWMDHLAEEINRSSVVSSKQSAAARGELDRILAQSEYGAVRPPSAWDLLRQRIAAWLERQLARLFGGIGRYPIAGKIVFWIVVFGAVVGIAFWLFRFLAGRDRLDALQQAAIVASTRTWQEWIHLARDAASRGDFRAAVHAAYWAGIARLEDIGVVPKDRSKTPREYLRSLSDAQPVEPALHPAAVREPLEALTSRFERAWYANRGASREDFAESLRHLEALGCHLE
jgi:hypothetical protein